MNAQQLRRKIIIQNVTETRDTMGGIIEAWATYKTAHAAIEPLSGREYFAAAQVNAEETTRIRLRYIEGVTPKMRVLWGTRIYNINAVIDVEEKRRELQLMCKEVI